MMKKPEKISQKNPFIVPEGYFEEVNKKIISATIENGYGDRKSVIPVRFRPYLLAAASIAGFIILGYAAIRLFTPHRLNLQQSEVIPDEYFLPYMNDLDIYYLEENAATLAIPAEAPDVSKAEIIEYLVLENIEISDIYEEL
jgi:hypothetical protein